MRNTIAISATILFVVSFFFYREFHISTARKACVKKVLKVNTALREEFDKAFEKELAKAEYKRKYAQMKREMAEYRVEVIEGKEKGISSKGMNFLYRICLARHGVKPENLVK